MKLISTHNIVDTFQIQEGVSFQVLENEKFVTINKNGSVYSHCVKPYHEDDKWLSYMHCRYIGLVELNDNEDWTTLVFEIR